MSTREFIVTLMFGVMIGITAGTYLGYREGHVRTQEFYGKEITRLQKWNDELIKSHLSVYPRK